METINKLNESVQAFGKDAQARVHSATTGITSELEKVQVRSQTFLVITHVYIQLLTSLFLSPTILRLHENAHAIHLHVHVLRDPHYPLQPLRRHHRLTVLNRHSLLRPFSLLIPRHNLRSRR
jgi:hypothetical protein